MQITEKRFSGRLELFVESLLGVLLLSTCATSLRHTTERHTATYYWTLDLRGPPPSPPLLFPLVQSLESDNSSYVALASDVSIQIPSAKSMLLVRAAQRAENQLRGLGAQADSQIGSLDVKPSWRVSQITVELATSAQVDESLDESTSYEYNISCDKKSGGCLVVAQGVFGLVAALQSTLPQLFAHRGLAGFNSLQIQDRPQNNLRGMMVDLGRRFIPKETLFSQVIDGMAFARMNYLQLHLSDNCRFALQLPSFPELTPPSGSRLEGQYTPEDVRQIVAYAHDRGIRIVPEIDVPGHSTPLLALRPRGLKVCNATSYGPTELSGPVIYDDPAGESRRVLAQLFSEVAAVFGQEMRWLHIGGDEVATPVGDCTAENVAALEHYLMYDVVHGKLNRTALAWADVLEIDSQKPKSEHELAAKPILVSWTGPSDKVADKGYRVIDAERDHSYLDLVAQYRPAGSFWRAGAAAQHNGILGGMSAMWTDKYCYKYQCGALPQRIGEAADTLPIAPSMFDRKMDAVFERSLAGIIWPRAAVAAASLWQYDANMNWDDVDRLANHFSFMLRRLTSVHSCPPGCECDELFACDRPYLPQNSR